MTREQVKKILPEITDEQLKSIVKRFFEAIKAFLKKISGLDRAERERLAQREYGATVAELERAVELWEASAKATQNKVKKATANIEGTKNDNPKFSLQGRKKPTYEDLVAKKPVKIVNVMGSIETGTYRDMKDSVLALVEEAGWLSKPHPNNDTDSLIFITEKSFSHAFNNLSSVSGADTIRSMAHIPEIIKEAILVDVDDPKDKTKAEIKVYTFFGAILGENGTKPIKLTVKEYAFAGLDRLPKNIRTYFEKNGAIEIYDSLYDAIALEVIGIEEIKKEPDASGKGFEQSPKARATSSSAIKVADLLELVNGDARKYIPVSSKGLKQLNENKKIEAVPPETLNRGLNGAQTASTDSKPQKAESVKGQYSNKINTEGMSEEAKNVVKRLKEQALISKYIDGKYATYTPDRINREIRHSYIDSKPDYAKSYIAWVSPSDFLYATTSSWESRDRIKNEAGELNIEKLREETQPIYLGVDFESGEIVGHEGRHRMVALQNAGVEKVAVIIDARNDDRYNTKPIVLTIKD